MILILVFEVCKHYVWSSWTLNSDSYGSGTCMSPQRSVLRLFVCKGGKQYTEDRKRRKQHTAAPLCAASVSRFGCSQLHKMANFAGDSSKAVCCTYWLKTRLLRLFGFHNTNIYVSMFWSLEGETGELCVFFLAFFISRRGEQGLWPNQTSHLFIYFFFFHAAALVEERGGDNQMSKTAKTRKWQKLWQIGGMDMFLNGSGNPTCIPSIKFNILLYSKKLTTSTFAPRRGMYDSRIYAGYTLSLLSLVKTTCPR